MFRLDADRPVEFCDGLRRRDFLHAGALSFLGLGLPQVFELQAQGAVDSSKKDVNCIHLMLVGGPSQLDTWDPEAERAGGDPRPVQGHQYQHIGHPDFGKFSAHGETRR